MAAHVLTADVEIERPAEDVVVVSPHGVVDAFSADSFAAALARAARPSARLVVLDLSRTDLVDSSGLGAILGASLRLREWGTRLVLVAGGRQVMRGFELTGLDRVLPIYGSRDEALG